MSNPNLSPTSVVSTSSLVREVRVSVTPESGKDYELWSVPSFAVRRPEHVDGSQIGSTKRRVEPRDVLLCKINPRINRVWIVGEGHAGFDQIASPEWLVLRTPEAGSRVTPEFLRHYLASPEFRDWVVMAVSGVTGSHTRAKAAPILRQKIPVPGLDEQRRIVEILEDHLSRLDASAWAVTASSQRLKRFHQSVLGSCLDSAATEPSTSRMTVGRLATVGTGATPLKSRKDYYVGGDIPWLTSGDLSQGLITAATQFVTPVALAETAIKVWPSGTLLVAMYGEGKTRGTTAELAIDGTTNQACAAIQLHDPDPSLRGWVRLALDANYWTMRRMASGGVQPNLNLGLVRSIELPIPPREARERLLRLRQTQLDAEVLLAGELALVDRRSLSLRRTLLLAAFAGRLTGRTTTDTEMIEEMALV